MGFGRDDLCEDVWQTGHSVIITDLEKEDIIEPQDFIEEMVQQRQPGVMKSLSRLMTQEGHC